MQDEDMDIVESEEDDQEQVTREESPRRITKTPSWIVQKIHLEEQIIGNTSDRVQARRQIMYQTKVAYLSQIEPTSTKEACKDESWVKAMNEELDQIENNQT